MKPIVDELKALRMRVRMELQAYCGGLDTDRCEWSYGQFDELIRTLGPMETRLRGEGHTPPLPVSELQLEIWALAGDPRGFVARPGAERTGERGWVRTMDLGHPGFHYSGHPESGRIAVSPHVKAEILGTPGSCVRDPSCFELPSPTVWLGYDGSRTPEQDEIGENMAVYRGRSLRNAMRAALWLPLLPKTE